jgi:hypothetical protein
MQLDLARLREPEGGSLNTTKLTETEFIKSYAGPLDRGPQKLDLEFAFLVNLSSDLKPRFPEVTGFHREMDAGTAELRMKRIEFPALAKAILDGKITPSRTAKSLAMILGFLTDDLYPLRGASISGADLYARFHGGRITRAVDHLAAVPAIQPLITGPDITVNGYPCPSIGRAVTWLHDHAGDFFRDARLVAGHGDAHLDNMMVSTKGPLDFRLIDPNGALLLPPHYDLAKLLKAVRTGYDPIHYGAYEIATRYSAGLSSISLRVSDAWTDHYAAGLRVLLGALPTYAAAEGVSESAFRLALAAAELAHIISFAWYHANHPAGCDVDRVTAYLAIAALLAADLMKDAGHVSRKLPIWGAA